MTSESTLITPSSILATHSAASRPGIDSQSVTALLNRAGFALSTVDVDEIQIAYPSMFELIDDLRWMGEGNAVVNRRPRLNEDTLMAAAAIYKGVRIAHEYFS